MINKTQIKICLGSSCFSRGNRELLTAVRKFIRVRKIDDKVAFCGDHCANACHLGPNIRIGGKLINNVSLENITEILEKNLQAIL